MNRWAWLKGAVLVGAAVVMASCGATAESRCLQSLEMSIEQMDADAVLADCEAVVRTGRANAAAEFAIGRALHKTGRLDEAQLAYRKAADAGFGRAFNNLGLLAPDSETALALYERGHGLGDPYSTLSLGYAYVNGNGVAADPERGVSLYQEASGRNLPLAKYYLALSLQGGLGIARDETAAHRLFVEAAEGGVGQAQHHLAAMLLNGNGAKKNTAEGLKWLEKAAASGLAGAQSDLALILERGKLVKKDDARALALVSAAAAQGFGPAEIQLARRYIEGRGVQADKTRGRDLLLSAASHGEPTAQYLSGMMFLNGEGVAKNAQQAELYLTAAAQNGIAPAITQLAMLRPETERASLLGQAAERGDAEALYHLAMGYLQGWWGLTQNLDTGWALMARASDLNHGQAMLSLAYQYRRGGRWGSVGQARAIYNRMARHPDPKFREAAQRELYDMDGGFEGEQNRKAMTQFVEGATSVFRFLGSMSNGNSASSSYDYPTPSVDPCASANEIYAWSGDGSYRAGYGCW